MQTLSAYAEPSTKTAYLVMVDGDRVVLESLPQALSSQGELTVCGRALDVKNGLEICQATTPDVLLLEAQPFRTGFRRLGDFLPVRTRQLKVALFADRLSDAELARAAAIPVVGFLSRQDSIPEIRAALLRVAEGQPCVSQHLASRITFNSISEEFEVISQRRLEQLTNLQLQVLICLAEGLRVREIAKRMHLSPKAIESHKYRIMQRLNVHDRLGLCRWAIREGLVEA
jgi:DNA-binding NarL/FixJ family response regulator